MAGIIVGIIGTIVTGYSIGQTALQNAKTTEGEYKYRIRIGQSVNEGDGWAPEVKVFDQDWSKLGRSNFEDHWITEDNTLYEETFGSSNNQIHHADLIAGNNAICLAWIEYYDADGSNPAVVLGDNILSCGHGYWPPTNTHVQQQPR